MVNMNAPMSEENKERAKTEKYWDYPIKLDVDYILGRFEKNHNRELFRNNDHEYWTLIKKAIVITVRMAEYYQDKSKDKSRYKFDDILVSGGGGGNEKYTIFASRTVAFWNQNIGEIEINFKEKPLNVWMNEWEDRENGIYSCSGKKLYKKVIPNLDQKLEMYNTKYYRKDGK